MSSFRPRHRNSFPNRTAENSRKTSECDASYNCFGWACGMQLLVGHLPGYFWPDSVPRPTTLTIQSMVQVYATMGYEECANADFELGYEKIAIYGDLRFADHAARQTPDGRWSSKLGIAGEDIEHDSLNVVSGGEYGKVARILRRRQSPTPESGAESA
jgi:hypothetical protein